MLASCNLAVGERLAIIRSIGLASDTSELEAYCSIHALRSHKSKR